MRYYIIACIFLLLVPEIKAQYLTAKDYDLITQNYKYYHWAASIVDIPTEVIIAIHHRESNLRRTRNIGGPFMLDCGAEGTPEFEARIRRHEKKIADKYRFNDDTRISHNFAFACLVAADFIKQKARYGLNTEKGVADMFWGYNGRIKGSYLNSAYVCSDPKNGNVMTFKYKNKVITDTRAGCLPIWKELKNNLTEGK